MRAHNEVQLIGRLAGDPENKTQEGSNSTFATFSIAVDRPAKKDQEGNIITKELASGKEVPDCETDFIRIHMSGKRADQALKTLSKGRRILLRGEIRVDRPQNKEGQTREYVGVRGESFLYMDPPPANRGSSAPPPESDNVPPDYDIGAEDIPPGDEF